MNDYRFVPVTNAILAHLHTHIETEVPFLFRSSLAAAAPQLSAELAIAAIAAVDATRVTT